MKLRATLLLSLLLAAAGLRAQPAPAVPSAQVYEHAGIAVPDPYRALEDVAAPATQQWMRAHSGWTREQLDRLPGLPALRARVDALDAARADTLGSAALARDGRVFYLKRVSGAQVARLYVREGGRERLLLDPDAWHARDGVKQAINAWSLSPDGRHVAAVISRNDDELGTLRVFSTRDGSTVQPEVPFIWGEVPGNWSADSRRIVAVQGADAGKPGGLNFGRMRLLELRLGHSEPRVLGGWQVPYGPEVRERDWVAVDMVSSAPYTLTSHYEGVSANARVWYTRSAELRADPAKARWKPLFGTEAQVQGVGRAGRWVYGRSFADAPRYRLQRWDLRHPERPPVDAVPPSDAVLDDFSVDAGGVYVVLRRGSEVGLHYLAHGAPPTALRPVALPYAGAVTLVDANALRAGAVFTLEGWTRELAVFQAQGTRVQPLPLIRPTGSTIGSDWQVREARCTSHDGVQVPMTVIHKRDLPADGARPTLMNGYGGYGIPELPFYSARLEAWLERGGVFAEVGPRGGGAFGRDWYQAGVGPRKSNTWKDMIACGEALVKMGLTRPDRLAIQGTSMGGVAVGRSITERPDLFAAALVRVGTTDALRFIEVATNGPNHLDEMGNAATPEGVRQLLAMSTYHQVQDGTRYPAVMLTAGLNDGRVPAWQAFKTYARLAAATSSGRPVLLRVDGEGGHGVGTTRAQQNAEFADRIAFLLWQLGDPAFQPPK